jgi:SAM-dependent methyltransferase
MLVDKTEWKESWFKNLELYLSKPPRTANFILSLINRDVKTILELGAGSCRDSLMLSRAGFDVIASDFEPATVELLKNRFKEEKIKIEIIDTFKINKENKSIDLIFHNGLFVLFSNQQIVNALIEQSRVAKRYILFLVHNSGNNTLINQYTVNKDKDRIYEIRFFSKKEINNLILESGIKVKKVKYLKFGGVADTFYDQTIKGIKNPFYFIAERLAPLFYRFQRMDKTERIACLIEL